MWRKASVYLWIGLFAAGCNWQSSAVSKNNTDETDFRAGSDTDMVTDDDDPQSDSADADTATDTDTDTDTDADTDTDTDTDHCGDGILDDDEACDDGNQQDDDGCSADCLEIEWWEPCGAYPCHRLAICGDGIPTLPEMCDDGNAESNDGCSPRCQLEDGFDCEGSPSHCVPVTCGDTAIEGAESCDDGNALPFDGCSAICRSEPICTEMGCTSTCGDGFVLLEACDDGNQIEGDGCSARCEVEPGYQCPPGTFDSTGIPTVEVPVIYRIFHSSHPDFTEADCDGDGTGMVQPELVEWRPVAGENIAQNCVTAFGDWFSDSPSITDTVTGTHSLSLAQNGQYMGAVHLRSLPEELLGSHGDAVYYTTEIHYWQVYDAAQSLPLVFRSTDEVWVFINGHLAVDSAEFRPDGEVALTIDDTGSGTFHLVDGGIYRISIFHAHRVAGDGSLFLTVGSSNISRSQCNSICGDGIVSIGEECDDGVNDGGYEECEPGCRMGAYCGDGVVQEIYEECDDGNSNGGDCTRNCFRCDACGG